MTKYTGLRMCKLLVVSTLAVLGASCEQGSTGDDIGCSAPTLDKSYTGLPLTAENFPNPTKIDNPYFPLVPGTKWTHKSAREQIDVVVTSDTRLIGGIKAVVVRDTVTLLEPPQFAGMVFEDTYDWYAQDKDGNVWYLGEATEERPPGKPVSTKGSWETGKDCAQHGLYMKAAPPQVGEPYRQEYHEGNAEDFGQVVAVDEQVMVPAGSFEKCIKTKDWSDLEPGKFEYKWYCPGVGNVKVEVGSQTVKPDPEVLVSFDPVKYEGGIGCSALRRDTSYTALALTPENFPNPTKIDNPYLPLVPGTKWTYKSTREQIDVVVTSDTRLIGGIKAVVVRDTVTLLEPPQFAGMVFEDTYDWYAQDKDGNVWYLGEATEERPPGKPVSTKGSWETGKDCAQHGIYMKADPTKVGLPYRQEYHAGNAQDWGDVVASGLTVSVTAGTYINCIRTKDWSELEPGKFEYKDYCPGVGNVVVEVGNQTVNPQREQLVSKTP